MPTLKTVEARLAQTASQTSIKDFTDGLLLHMKMNPGENRRFDKAWTDADIATVKEVLADYLDEMEVEPVTPPGALNRGRL